MTIGKTRALPSWTFVGRVMSLLFNMLSSLVIVFSSKDKVSFNFMTVVTIHSDFGSQENKVSHYSHCCPIYLPRSDGTRWRDLRFFKCLVLSQCVSLSSSTFIKRLFSSSLLSAIGVVSSAYLRLLIFLPEILIPACASSNLAFCCTLNRS